MPIYVIVVVHLPFFPVANIYAQQTLLTAFKRLLLKVRKKFGEYK